MIKSNKYGFAQSQKKEDYGSEIAKREVNKHKTETPIDHPDGSVTTAKIADGAVTSAKIADGAVTSAKIADGAVTSAKIDYRAVTEDKIAEKAVTIDKLEDDLQETVSKLIGQDVPFGEVHNLSEYRHKDVSGWFYFTESEPFYAYNDLGEDVSRLNYNDEVYWIFSQTLRCGKAYKLYKTKQPVSGADPENGAITVQKEMDAGYFGKVDSLENEIKAHEVAEVLDHPDGAVTSAKIADGAVTTAKIDDGAVTGAKLANNAVHSNAIAEGAVTTDRIYDGAVTDDKIEIV